MGSVTHLRPVRDRDLVDVRRRSAVLGFVIPVWFTTDAYAATRDTITDVLWSAFFAAAAFVGASTDRATIVNDGTALVIRFEYDADGNEMLVVMTPEES